MNTAGDMTALEYLRGENWNALAPEALAKAVADAIEAVTPGVRVGATPEPTITTTKLHGVDASSFHVPESNAGYVTLGRAQPVGGATPEPLTPLRSQFQDALGRYWDCAYADGRAQESLSALLDIFDRAALRAPEPLTAELEFAAQVLEKEADDLHVCQFPKREAKFRRALAGVRAALEGGVSPQQGWNEGFVKGHAMASEIRDIGEALVAARAKFGLEGGVHQTESAGEAVQRPVGEGQWIATSERLPAEHDLVIVDGGVARFRRGEWITETGHASGRPIQWHVTHWMPLPALSETQRSSDRRRIK